MWRGSKLILFIKSVFMNYYLELRFERGPCMLGEGLDSYLKPTARCGGFLSVTPLIEVRVYVSIFLFKDRGCV